MDMNIFFPKLPMKAFTGLLVETRDVHHDSRGRNKKENIEPL